MTGHLSPEPSGRPVGRLAFDVGGGPWIETGLSALVFYARVDEHLVKCGVTARLLSTHFKGEGLNPFDCFERHRACIHLLLQEVWTRTGPNRGGVVLLE